MNLKMNNTLTGEKERFVPLKKGEVSIYVCGVTLYDDIHIGHLKSIMAFEVMRNYFISQGNKVTLVRNITDVDDKIIAKADALNINPLDLVNQYVDKFHALLKKMGISPPDVEPRVTEYLKEIEVYIEDLKASGHAYDSTDGIYFNTQINTPERYPLSKKIVKDLEDNTRLDSEDYSKHHKADFALWKLDEKYGYHSNIFKQKGRPGWHIECSVMHHHTLGQQFDIHGGGRDLIFPHHENEILQSVAHNGVNPAHYWLHNGMMTKNGQKLSKSLGNSIYVKDMLELYTPEALKLFLNKGQYNQSQEFNEQEIKESHQRWNTFVEDIPLYTQSNQTIDNSFYTKVITALEDDFNTPQAIVILYSALKELKQTHSKLLALEVLKIIKLLNIVAQDSTLESIHLNWLSTQLVVPDTIIALAEKRIQAKKDNNYELADTIRIEIKEKGWEIRDIKNSYELRPSQADSNNG